jgi:putative serine protease PepD
MSNSLLHPSPVVPPTGRRGRVALVAVLAALLGSGASTGLLLAAGAIDTGDAAPMAQTSSGNAVRTSSASSSGLDASAVYASTAAAVVDITARGVAGGADAGPFGRQSESTATGTGFVIDGDGHVLTAAHVVDGASSITLTFQDGTKRTAKLLGKDDATDVAVLEVDPSGLDLQPLQLGSSSSLAVGDQVAAIGDPFGYERSLSTGIVSGLDRTIEAPNGFTVAHAIQTDAALNPGNSGGPVLDADGKVVGIADQIATNGSSQSNTGVGFAVPIDLVKSELNQLIAGESVSHAYLGVSTTDTNASGALVAEVASGSPAADAGLRSGDVITEIGSTEIRDSNDLVAATAGRKPGDEVTVRFRRGSDTHDASVTLGTQPAQASAG